MKHGDIVGKDAYGRDIKVGDLVDTYEWYNLELRLSRKLILGITNGKNYRTLAPYLNGNNLLTNSCVGWEYIKRPVLAVREPMFTNHISTNAYYDWLNEYLGKGQPVEMFDKCIMERFTVKELKQYKLELFGG